MYNKHNASRPRRSSGRKSGPSKPGNRSSRGRTFSGKSISIDKFISKATVSVPSEEIMVKSSFSDIAINDALKQSVTRRGYSQPTDIQSKVIPLVLEGKDVIGLANTGTGKTAAFIIPMINKIMQSRNEKLLIVAPTRELAIQINEEFAAFAKNLKIHSVVVVGGASIGKQMNELRLAHNVIIGTPGRLRDLIERRKIDLSRFGNVVVDEADQMLDMGFLPEIKYLLSLVAKVRQTLLFSATLSPEIENLVRTFLRNPQKVSIKTRETSAQVEQDVVRIGPGKEKIEVLHDLLAKSAFKKVLIFARTKHGTEKLSRVLRDRGFKSESIHGDKSHEKRQKAMKSFKENRVEILVATDVAARGLDIPNVSHVINYDIPATYEDYIHRIGRTGRADKKGIALTFIG